MKDYKLSEIKEICKKQLVSCEGCEFNKGNSCELIDDYVYPVDWQIEKEQDPKNNPENYKEINDKLC